MPIPKQLTRPFSCVIKNYGDARIAYEYRVAKVSSDRGIVGPLLGANDSFDLKVSQAADKATCVVRIEHVCAPSI